MKVLFYITQFEKVKDATQFYLETINKALTGSSELSIKNNIRDIKNVEFVITFTVTDFFKLKIRKPRIKIIHWFQGILPEEVLLKSGNQKQYFILGWLERFVLKLSYANFFVSDAMRKHFNKKYGYKKSNFVLMPCFNGILKAKEDFIKKKQISNKFVYIGSMASWQCLEDILLSFKKIKNKKPDSQLTIFTGEQEKAKALCEKYGVIACIDYVPLADISNKLLEFNYGFLLRDDHLVNRVATPTKMSTYLASGVIPIYSDVIEDFKIFDNLTYKVKVDQQHDDLIKKIRVLEKRRSEQHLFEEYKNIFQQYYNSTYYIEIIRKHYLFNKF